MERVASPRAYLVDLFLVLMKLPMWAAPFKREQEELRKEGTELFNQLQDDGRQEMREGRTGESWKKYFLENKDDNGILRRRGGRGRQARR